MVGLVGCFLPGWGGVGGFFVRFGLVGSLQFWKKIRLVSLTRSFCLLICVTLVMLDVHQQKRCCLTSTVVYRLFFTVFCTGESFRRRQTEAAGCALHLSTEVQICGRLGPHDAHVEHQQWGWIWCLGPTVGGGLEMLLKMRGWQLEMKSCGPWKPTKIQRWFGLWIHIKWLPKTWYLIVVNNLPFQAASKSIWTSLKPGEPLKGTPASLPYGPRKMWMPSTRLFWVQVRRLHCEMGMMSCHAAVWIFHWHTERSDKVCGEIVLKC